MEKNNANMSNEKNIFEQAKKIIQNENKKNDINLKTKKEDQKSDDIKQKEYGKYKKSEIVLNNYEKNAKKNCNNVKEKINVVKNNINTEKKNTDAQENNIGAKENYISAWKRNINTVENDNNVGKNMALKNIKTKKLRYKVLLIILLIILILLFCSSFVFGFVTSESDKIISGVSINGINVSNLTKNEALQKLNNELSKNYNKEITLTHGDYSTKLDLNTVEPKFDFDTALNEAFEIGRNEKNIFENNKKVISVYMKNQNIIPTVSINVDKLAENSNKINKELPDKVINGSYKVEDNKLIISNSANGNRVSNDRLADDIKNCIINNTDSVEIPVEQYKAETIDIDAIYNEIHKEPVDAYYTTNPYEVHKEEDGLDFAISLDKARELVKQDQSEIVIQLKTLKPKVTVKTLSQQAFPDLLATYSTTYSTGNASRATNIGLATKSVNGYVLMPGETFSYNSTVGERTPQRGYKEAGVYLNGEVTTGYGGGICQVSSTLYNATLLANLEIVERSNHTFKPGYVPAGQDATVSWGSPDFKFKNNRNYPIKINAVNSNGTVTFNIYGLKTADDYEVKILSYEVGSIPFSTEYQETASLPAGTQKVAHAGSDGCKTQTYKVLYKNGAEVSRKLINSDTYKPHNQVVSVGTGSGTASASSGTSTTAGTDNGAGATGQSQTVTESATISY